MKDMANKKETSNAAAELGRKGGRAVVKKHGKDYMKKLGKKGSDARWPEGKKDNGNKSAKK